MDPFAQKDAEDIEAAEQYGFGAVNNDDDECERQCQKEDDAFDAYR